MIPTALALAGGFLVLGYGSRGPRMAGRQALQEDEARFEALGRERGG